MSSGSLDPALYLCTKSTEVLYATLSHDGTIAPHAGYTFECRTCVFYRHLYVLQQQAGRHGMVNSFDSYAERRGHPEVLKWLKENGCP